VDVCTQSHVWEVKYFGPEGFLTAQAQLRRYRDAEVRNQGFSRRLGFGVTPSVFPAKGRTIVAFSVANTGVRLYMPLNWYGNLPNFDPVRARFLNENIKVQELAGAIDAYLRTHTGSTPFNPWAVIAGGAAGALVLLAKFSGEVAKNCALKPSLLGCLGPTS
jgi:hypothetical protein